MPTVRARITTALLARLAQISPANGYATTLGARVFHGRNSFTPGDLSAGPVCILHMPAEQRAGDSGDAGYQIDATIIVEAHILPADPLNPAASADLLIGDIKRGMLRSDQLRLADPAILTDMLEYQRCEVAMPEPGQIATSVLLEFSARYAERYGDPSALL